MTSSVLGQADLAFPGEKTVVDLVGVQAGRVVTASFRRSPATKSSSPCLKTEVTTRYSGSPAPASNWSGKTSRNCSRYPYRWPASSRRHGRKELSLRFVDLPEFIEDVIRRAVFACLRTCYGVG